MSYQHATSYDLSGALAVVLVYFQSFASILSALMVKNDGCSSLETNLGVGIIQVLSCLIIGKVFTEY